MVAQNKFGAQLNVSLLSCSYYLRKSLHSVTYVALTAGLTLSVGVYAQEAPEAGSIQKQIESTPAPSDIEIPEEKAAPKPPIKKEGPQLEVTQFSFYGHTILSDSELASIVEPWITKKLTLDELKYITSLIAERYSSMGYLARVYLPKQDINDGRVIIAIAEAKYGKVKVDDSQHIKDEVISPRFVEKTVSNGFIKGEILSLKRLEHTTLIVNDLPGIRAQNVLVAGAEEGATDVAVKVTPDRRYTGSVTADNYGVKSTGDYRLMPSLQIANPFHRGDDIRLLGLISEGNQYGRVSYGYPVGYRGLRLNASASVLSYSLGGDFDALSAEGDASTIGLDLTYPLVRQLRSNTHITGSIAKRSYDNEQLGENISSKEVSILKIGVKGNHFDQLGLGGGHYYSADLSLGQLDLAGNKENQAQDAASSQTEGDYTIFSWNYGRYQKLADKTSLWASFAGQITSNKLDSSETLSLGGPNGIRAYPVLEASGDTGVITTIEVRHIFHSDLTLTGFVDYGRVTQKSTETQEEKSLNLKGFGVSAVWALQKDLSASFIVANRIGDNPLSDPETGNDSNGSKKLFPVWLKLTKTF